MPSIAAATASLGAVCVASGCRRSTARCVAAADAPGSQVPTIPAALQATAHVPIAVSKVVKATVLMSAPYAGATTESVRLGRSGSAGQAGKLRHVLGHVLFGVPAQRAAPGHGDLVDDRDRPADDTDDDRGGGLGRGQLRGDVGERLGRE